MKIAILSDTHGRVGPVQRARAVIEKRGIAYVLHCGDVDDAGLVTHLPAGTHFVWGNCDRDRAGIERAVAAISGVHHGSWGHLELDGVKIAFVHGDDHRLLYDLENSVAHDFLFYGHTHARREHRTGKTRVINPGALHRVDVKTFAILDLETGTVETIALDG